MIILTPRAGTSAEQLQIGLDTSGEPRLTILDPTVTDVALATVDAPEPTATIFMVMVGCWASKAGCTTSVSRPESFRLVVVATMSWLKSGVPVAGRLLELAAATGLALGEAADELEPPQAARPSAASAAKSSSAAPSGAPWRKFL